jgi:UDP-N-acetyl-D-glucosamine dehydrogenase
VVEATAVDALVTRVDPTPAEISRADAVVLLTDHDAFDFTEVASHARYCLDCRNRLAGPNVELLLGGACGRSAWPEPGLTT